MSYLASKSGGSRSAVVVAVAAIHGAAIYALITGLGIDYIKETIVNLPTREYASPPEPEPVTEPPRQENKDSVTTVVQPRIAVAPANNDLAVDVTPMLHDLPDFTIKPLPLPIPPRFKPVAASPATNPANWVGANDYPTRDIRQGNEGTARFRLAIGADGKVQGCEIVSSSGHAGLDHATCQNVSRRARFDPARNENGMQVAGSYSGSIKWVIPR